MREELQQKNAIIEVADMCEVNVIPFQFRQLMYNLISNSLKFNSGQHNPHVRITSEIASGEMVDDEKFIKEMKYCHISISDNGIGFEQQYGEKIFEVFQRLHNKDKFSGTGIGLAIVKKIVENHDGYVAAKGELNKGAIFEIYIPA